MTQKDKKEPGLFDFPLDPTPSLKAYNKFIKSINEYLSMFVYSEGILSIGPIKLGTPHRAFVKAPIDIDPREIERRLRPVTHCLAMAIGEAEQSMNWTRKIIKQTGSESPKAEKRIQDLENIVAEIQNLLDYHRGMGWHPKCYEQIRKLVKRSFIPGKPGIAIQITILV